MSTVVEHGTSAAAESERAALAEIERLLTRSGATEPPRIVGAGGVEVPIPESLLHALRQLVHGLTHDHPVTVLAFPRELTTQQAADILNVSRPFLVKQLLDTGQIPYAMTGTHRRIAFDDLMAYKRRRDTERRRTLRELSQLSQQMGLE
jgi:excisionase family DNA binding protein